MMAAEQQITTAPAAEWTYGSDAAARREIDALLHDPLWSLLGDEAIASIAKTSPDVIRDERRALRASGLLRLMARVVCRDAGRHG